MNRETIAIDTPFVRPDAYGSLSVPLYTNVSFEFDNAALMADVFTGRVNMSWLADSSVLHRAP